MSLCAQCGNQTDSAERFCAYHAASESNEWSAANRMMCNGLHRGAWPAPDPDAPPFLLTSPIDAHSFRPVEGYFHADHPDVAAVATA